VALGHGVSAQQGVLKVAHSDILGRLRPRSWRGGSGGINPWRGGSGGINPLT